MCSSLPIIFSYPYLPVAPSAICRLFQPSLASLLVLLWIEYSFASLLHFLSNVIHFYALPHLINHYNVAVLMCLRGEEASCSTSSRSHLTWVWIPPNSSPPGMQRPKVVMWQRLASLQGRAVVSTRR